MRVQVELFARARDLAGSAALVLELAEASTVAGLRRAVVDARPALAGFLDRCAIAVDDEYAPEELSLRHGARIAVLPPVSGG